jgi:hypothetical protein
LNPAEPGGNWRVMSPTSYQAAPPRFMTIANGRGAGPPRFQYKRNPGQLHRNSPSDQLSPRTPPAIVYTEQCRWVDLDTRTNASPSRPPNFPLHPSVSARTAYRSIFITLYFHHLTNPYSRKPFIFTSIQNPRGLTLQHRPSAIFSVSAPSAPLWLACRGR